MMKRLAAAGILSLATGGVLMAAGPALAQDNNTVSQLLGVQTCREVNVIGLDVLSTNNESGPCNNGSVTTANTTTNNPAPVAAPAAAPAPAPAP